MILLAIHAAIFYELTATALLELYFINSCFAAVSTYFVGRCLIFYLLFAVHNYDNY
jgi:hypothetical protein